MSDIFTIVDLTRYAASMRKNAVLSLSDDVESNLDQFITLSEVGQLIKNNSVGEDEEGNYLITEDTFNQTFDEIRTWIEGVVLANLAAQDKIECAWDDEANEMVFWSKKADGQTNTGSN